MDVQFAADWDALGRLAFRRQEKIGAIFKRVDAIMRRRTAHPEYPWLKLVKTWLLCPFTLWPIDFGGLAQHICQRLQAGRRVEPGVGFILHQMENLPSEKEQKAVSDYERLVEEGN